MADISVIQLPSGSSYNIKDATARSQIETIQNTVTGAMHYAGVTTSALTDGATTNPISIGGANYTAQSGDVVIYSTREYVFSDTDNKWHEFGSTGSLKALAFKDTASATYTPAGSVSSSFTGTPSNVTITTEASSSGNYTPAGSITQPTFSGNTLTSTGKFTPSGNVTVSTNTTTNKTATVSPTTGTATYTPAGSVSASFTGSNTTFTGVGTYTPAGSVSLTKTNKTATVSSTTGTATYTPAGSVTTTLNVAGSTTTIKNPTSKTMTKAVTVAAPGSTAPANSLTYYSVSGETLSLYQIGFTTEASITTENVSVKNGDASYSSSFSGTGARLVTGNISTADSASFSGTEGTADVTVSGTPLGSVTDASFSGTGVRLVTGNIAVPNTYTASFVGTEGNVSVSGEPSGTVSQPTFQGTKVQISGTVTPSGNVSSTFTGTEATITVS